MSTMQALFQNKGTCFRLSYKIPYKNKDADMIICPHCKKAIKFNIVTEEGTFPYIEEIKETTITEFRLMDEGK